jgi:hypothetical protein
MAIGYYMFAHGSKECISLGYKGRRNDHEYQGPVVFLLGKRYFLPAKYLNLLTQRFIEKNGEENVIVCTDYDLFDTETYLKEDEDYLKIGGDRYFDPPLTQYLPELENDSVQSEVESRSDLKID